jgi:hypothetical protein
MPRRQAGLQSAQLQGVFMSQQALIRGEVCFREGDGMPMPIPAGPVELDVADDSVTISWDAGNDSRGVTAITRDEYDRYRREGKIRLASG